MSYFHDYMFAMPTIILAAILLLVLMNDYPVATLTILGAILTEALFQNGYVTIIGAVVGAIFGWTLASVRKPDPADQFHHRYFGT